MGSIAPSTASPATAGISPNALCHVVLRTTPANFEKMVSFYTQFLAGSVTWRSDKLAFITYDYEHHRIAILSVPGLQEANEDKPQTGLAHIAFGFATLQQLATSYESKRDQGFKYIWAVNHGMSTSIYYEDPDGNEVETQVDNFETAEEATDFMKGEEFTENPIGVDFDPEVFCGRVRNGEDLDVIKRRPRIGYRDKR